MLRGCLLSVAAYCFVPACGRHQVQHDAAAGSFVLVYQQTAWLPHLQHVHCNAGNSATAKCPASQMRAAEDDCCYCCCIMPSPAHSPGQCFACVAAANLLLSGRLHCAVAVLRLRQLKQGQAADARIHPCWQLHSPCDGPARSAATMLLLSARDTCTFGS